MTKTLRFLAAVLLALATAASAQVGSPPGVGYPPFTSGGTFTGSLLGPTNCTLPAHSFSADTNAGLCLAAANTVRVQNNVSSGVSTSYVNLGATIGSLVFNDAAAFDSQVRVYDDTVDMAAAGATQLTIAGATSMFTFGNTTTRDELILQPVAAGAGSFAGTFTTADLTAAREWTFPDTTGTALLATGPAAMQTNLGSYIEFDEDAAGGDAVYWIFGNSAGDYWYWDLSGWSVFTTGTLALDSVGNTSITSDANVTITSLDAVTPNGSIQIGNGDFNPQIALNDSLYQNVGGGFHAITFEGGVDDAFDIFLDARDPAAADQTITLPASTGEVVVASVFNFQIPNNAAGASPATYTLDPNGVTVVTLDCADPDGCEVTMAETFARVGQPLTIIESAATAGNITLIHNGTSATLDGGANVVYTGVSDAVQLVYISAVWVQIAPLYDAS